MGEHITDRNRDDGMEYRGRVYDGVGELEEIEEGKEEDPDDIDEMIIDGREGREEGRGGKGVEVGGGKSKERED